MRLLDEAVAKNTDPSLKAPFEKLMSMDNVPRKKAKFINFVQNCCRLPNNTVEKVWAVLEEVHNKQIEERKKRDEALREQVRCAFSFSSIAKERKGREGEEGKGGEEEGKEREEGQEGQEREEG